MMNAVRTFRVHRGVCVILLGLGTAAVCLATELTLTWWTVDAGGNVTSSGLGYTLSGTIGQPDAGTVLTGSGWQLAGGFWSGLSAGPIGDCDGDGLLGIPDFVALTDCLNGPQTTPATGCSCADQDGDGDVDVADAAALQRAFGSL